MMPPFGCWSEVKVQRGRFSGCLLIVISALVAVALVAVIVSWDMLETSPDAEEASQQAADGAKETATGRATGVAPADPAQTAKIQDRATAAEAPAQPLRPRGARTQQASLGVSPEATEGQGSLWTYAGSYLRLEAVGRSRRFYFAGLRRGLLAKDGDVAFDGVREGPAFSGRAFLFTENCAPIPYAVRGSISTDETTIRLRGKEPRRDARCNVVSSVDSELVFTLASKAQRPPARASATLQKWDTQAKETLPDAAPQ